MAHDIPPPSGPLPSGFIPDVSRWTISRVETAKNLLKSGHPFAASRVFKELSKNLHAHATYLDKKNRGKA